MIFSYFFRKMEKFLLIIYIDYEHDRNPIAYGKNQ